MSLIRRVNRLLEEKEYCRDSDMSLCSEVWCEECTEQELVFSDLSIPIFLHLITEGKLSKQQSILRCRRMVNQKMPELKGKSYKAKTKKKPEYIKHKPLPNLIKTGLQDININSLLDKNGKPQFPHKHRGVGLYAEEQAVN